MGQSPSPSVQQLLVLYAGKSVPFHFSWGFVALSYLVSLIGAGSTLELINRRTSIKGRYNQWVTRAVLVGRVGRGGVGRLTRRAVCCYSGPRYRWAGLRYGPWYAVPPFPRASGPSLALCSWRGS